MTNVHREGSGNVRGAGWALYSDSPATSRALSLSMKLLASEIRPSLMVARWHRGPLNRWTIGGSCADGGHAENAIVAEVDEIVDHQRGLVEDRHLGEAARRPFRGRSLRQASEVADPGEVVCRGAHARSGEVLVALDRYSDQK
jgi:hypothetical protein